MSDKEKLETSIDILTRCKFYFNYEQIENYIDPSKVTQLFETEDNRIMILKSDVRAQLTVQEMRELECEFPQSGILPENIKEITA